MEIYSHPDIAEILAIEDNQKCMDCGTAKPKWASINNGVFLCLKCAGLHRNFGLNISVIRSLQIDSWDDKQIMFLKKGGDANYKELLKEFNLLSTNSLDLKYKTKAADYYRKKLRQDVEKEINPDYRELEIEKLDITTGLEIIETKTNDADISNNDIIGSTKQPEPKNESFFGFVGSFFKSAGQKVIETSKDITKKVQDLEIGSKLKETGMKTVEIAKKSGQYVVEGTQKVYVSIVLINIIET